MLIENDFEHDDGHQRPDAPASPPPPPLVVIQYRNRGIPLLLVPPFLILAAILGFQAHRRLTPPRRVLVSPPVLAADEARPAGPSSTGAEEEAGRFLARVDSFATPALDPVAPPAPSPPPEPAAPPAPGPFHDVAIIMEEVPTPPPAEPDRVDEPIAETPPPVEPAAPGPDPSAGTDPPPPPPEPDLTKEQVLDRIRREARQEADRLRALEAWKPRLLEKDRRLAEEIREVHLVEVQRQAEAKRVAFHADLRKLIAALGDRAGPQINGLCENYGRVTLPEIFEAVQTRLRRTSTGLGRRDKVEMMRRLGLPEPLILDALTRDASRFLRTRGGPRNMDEVRALAARQLLAIPPSPTPRARAAARPVTEASMAPVPGAGRRPQ